MTEYTPEQALQTDDSFINEFHFFKKMASNSPFCIFNLSEKDVVGFYKRKNAIGEWHDGSPLVHIGELESQVDGISKYNGTCYDNQHKLRSSYKLFEGDAFNEIGKKMLAKLNAIAPGLFLSPSPNPTVFSLTDKGTLPLHRDFDTGLRAILSLDATQTAHLDFENNRIDLKPNVVNIFPTGRLHGLNIHEPKMPLTLFTVCLISAEIGPRT